MDVDTNYSARQVHVFDSAHDLMTALALSGGYEDNPYGNGAEWIDNLTHDDAKRFAQYGCAALVPSAQEMLDRFDAELPTMRLQTEPSVAGYAVDIGDYLSCDPECMRGVQWTLSDIGPMNIGVCLESGCRQCYDLDCTTEPVEASSFKLRGVAALAMAMRFAAVRPVNLYGISTMNCRRHQATTRENYAVCMVRIHSEPFDVATAAYVLGHVGFSRACCYRWQELNQSARAHFPRLIDDTCIRQQQAWIDKRFADRYAARIGQIIGWDPESSIIIGPTQAKFSGDDVDGAIGWTMERMNAFIAHGRKRE